MGKRFARLEPEHTAFIERQKIFFVASAPPKGRINVSPKGLSSFRVLGDSDVGYLDFTGSGSETRAHLMAADDRRLTIMFCAFEGDPVMCPSRSVTKTRLPSLIASCGGPTLISSDMGGGRSWHGVSSDINALEPERTRPAYTANALAQGARSLRFLPTERTLIRAVPLSNETNASHEDCADFTAHRKRSAAPLRRHRARRLLSYRRAGAARPPSHPLRERRLDHLCDAGALLCRARSASIPMPANLRPTMR